MAKSQERVDARRKEITKFLKKEHASNSERGKTVKEISKGIDESETVVRVDLEALKADGVKRDTKRVPNVYWLEP